MRPGAAERRKPPELRHNLLRPGVTNPFAFLQAEWPDVFDAALRAASAAHPDPRAACFYARRALELTVAGPTNTTARSACRIKTT